MSPDGKSRLNSNEELPSTDIVHFDILSSDDDDDQEVNYGYSLLEQNNDASEQSENESEDENKIPKSLVDYETNPKINNFIEKKLSTNEKIEREWNKKLSYDINQNPINLNKDNIETIMKCMSKINLPSSSIPNWANSISEETLTNFIHDKIKKK